MRRRAAATTGALLALLLAGAASADPVPLPSGIGAELIDVRQEAQSHVDETWLILRLHAPALGDDADAALADLDWLCDSMGLHALTQLDGEFAAIVVALMDRPIPWGEADPDAVQYVSSYRVEDGACMPDIF